MNLRLIHNEPPSEPSARMNWKRRKLPVSHVAIRDGHPSLAVHDYENEDCSVEEIALDLDACIRWVAENAPHPDLQIAAANLKAAWRRGQLLARTPKAGA